VRSPMRSASHVRSNVTIGTEGQFVSPTIRSPSSSALTSTFDRGHRPMLVLVRPLLFEDHRGVRPFLAATNGIHVNHTDRLDPQFCSGL